MTPIANNHLATLGAEEHMKDTWTRPSMHAEGAIPRTFHTGWTQTTCFEKCDENSFGHSSSDLLSSWLLDDILLQISDTRDRVLLPYPPHSNPLMATVGTSQASIQSILEPSNISYVIQAPNRRLEDLAAVSTVTEGRHGDNYNTSCFVPEDTTASTTRVEVPKSRRKKKKNHSQFCQLAFTACGIYPNEYLRSCLDLTLNSIFLLKNDEEPTIGSENGNLILGGMPMMFAFCPRLMEQLGKSIYMAFIDSMEKRCLMCGERKTSISRALNCVRSHLNHKPFGCPGLGCKLCKHGRTSKFTSKALLGDHIRACAKPY